MPFQIHVNVLLYSDLCSYNQTFNFSIIRLFFFSLKTKITWFTKFNWRFAESCGRGWLKLFWMDFPLICLFCYFWNVWFSSSWKLSFVFSNFVLFFEFNGGGEGGNLCLFSVRSPKLFLAKIVVFISLLFF